MLLTGGGLNQQRANKVTNSMGTFSGGGVSVVGSGNEILYTHTHTVGITGEQMAAEVS